MENNFTKLIGNTPLIKLEKVSRITKCNILGKAEFLNPGQSVKDRAALYIIKDAIKKKKLKKNGIIVEGTAGNTGFELTLVENSFELNSVIVMPKTTPEIKIESVKRMDAEVILFGNNYDEAKKHAINLSVEKTMFYVSPYDHPLVIAGQATVGVELLEQHPNSPDIIFVPVGGGGLIAGIAAYIKVNNPNIKITRLARGLPVGGHLEYVDEATLTRSINERVELHFEE